MVWGQPEIRGFGMGNGLKKGYKAINNFKASVQREVFEKRKPPQEFFLFLLPFFWSAHQR